MAKDPIDKLFRDKLADRKFEYRDSFWKEAEKGINPVNRGIRFKGAVKNPYFIGFSIAVIVSAVFMFQHLIDRNQHVQENEAASTNVHSIMKSPRDTWRMDEEVRSKQESEEIRNGTKEKNDPLDQSHALGKNDALNESNLTLGNDPIRNAENNKPNHNNDMADPGSGLNEKIKSGKDDQSDERRFASTNDRSNDIDTREKITLASGSESITEAPTGYRKEIQIQNQNYYSVEPVMPSPLHQPLPVQLPDSAYIGDKTGPGGERIRLNDLKHPSFIRLGAAIFGGIQYNQSKLFPVSEQGSPYVDKRTAHTSDKATGEFGLLASAHYQSWSLSTGAIWNSYQAQTSYTRIISSVITDTNTYSYVDSSFLTLDTFLGRNDSMWKYMLQDTFTVDSAGTRNESGPDSLNGRIKYSYVEIPLLIGYEFALKNGKTALFLRGGPSLGILRSVKGYQLDPVTDKLTALRQPSFNKTFFFAVVGGGVSHELFPSLSIYGELTSKWNLTDIRENAHYRERLNQYAFRIGLGYRF